MQHKPSTAKQSVVAEFRRNEILAGACRAFARCGYESTTVDSIAAEAKIAKGTVYLYYKSKADIYHAAVTHGLQQLHQETQDALQKPGKTCRERIEHFVRLRTEYVDHHRDFYRIFLTELYGTLKEPSQFQKQVRSIVRRQTKLLEAVIDEGVKSGEIRRVPVAATALAIYDLSRGLLRNRLIGIVDTDRTVDHSVILDLLWNGLGPTK